MQRVYMSRHRVVEKKKQSAFAKATARFVLLTQAKKLKSEQITDN